MQNLLPKKIILIGASTGGPGHIQRIVAALPKLSDTSIVIAQHMGQEFIPSFIKRLQEVSDNPVLLAKDRQSFNPAHIYLCSGSTKVILDDGAIRFSHHQAPQYTYNPDINILFKSFIPFGNRFDILAVILTGIGEDGVEGCQLLGENRAHCITEHAQSAIVDGMPSRARETIPGIEIAHIDEIIERIMEFVE